MKHVGIFSLSLLSTYRTELMGLSAVGIIACHAGGNHVMMPSWLSHILGLGQLGVSVFFLLSGIGIWYSLQNQDNMNRYEWGRVVRWYKKRYIKLFVPYLLIATPCFAYSTIAGDHGFRYFLLNISTIQFWIDRGGAWFVSVLVALYFISPWWEWFLNRVKGVWGSILSAFVFVSIYLCGRSFTSHASEICFYFLGFWVAPYVKRGITIKWIPLLLGAGGLYLLFHVIPSLSSFTRSIFLVPFMIIVPSLLFGLPRLRVIIKPFRFMGSISLESYLTNIFMPMFFVQATWIKDHPQLGYGNRYGYLMVIVVGVLLSVVVHKLSNRILSIKLKS